MNPKVWLLLERARDDLSFAEDTFRSGRSRAASDAYYAMFHAAEALLLALGLELSSHSATHAAFGLHFAKTRKLDPKLHRYLMDAFDTRITADYDVTVRLKPEEVEVLLAHAKEFVAAAEEYLRLPGGEPPPDPVL